MAKLTSIMSSRSKPHIYSFIHMFWIDWLLSMRLALRKGGGSLFLKIHHLWVGDGIRKRKTCTIVISIWPFLSIGIQTFMCCYIFLSYFPNMLSIKNCVFWLILFFSAAIFYFSCWSNWAFHGYSEHLGIMGIITMHYPYHFHCNRRSSSILPFSAFVHNFPNSFMKK